MVDRGLQQDVVSRMKNVHWPGGELIVVTIRYATSVGGVGGGVGTDIVVRSQHFDANSRGLIVRRENVDELAYILQPSQDPEKYNWSDKALKSMIAWSQIPITGRVEFVSGAGGLEQRNVMDVVSNVIFIDPKALRRTKDSDIVLNFTPSASFSCTNPQNPVQGAAFARVDYWQSEVKRSGPGPFQTYVERWFDHSEYHYFSTFEEAESWALAFNQATELGARSDLLAGYFLDRGWEWFAVGWLHSSLWLSNPEKFGAYEIQIAPPFPSEFVGRTIANPGVSYCDNFSYSVSVSTYKRVKRVAVSTPDPYWLNQNGGNVGDYSAHVEGIRVSSAGDGDLFRFDKDKGVQPYPIRSDCTFKIDKDLKVTGPAPRDEGDDEDDGDDLPDDYPG